MKVLVTGGLGFIGSHTVVELLEENNELDIQNAKNTSAGWLQESGNWYYMKADGTQVSTLQNESTSLQ